MSVQPDILNWKVEKIGGNIFSRYIGCLQMKNKNLNVFGIVLIMWWLTVRALDPWQGYNMFIC